MADVAMSAPDTASWVHPLCLTLECRHFSWLREVAKLRVRVRDIPQAALGFRMTDKNVAARNRYRHAGQFPDSLAPVAFAARHDRVEGPLVEDRVEGGVAETERSHIADLEGVVGEVQSDLHVTDDHGRDIEVRNIFVASLPQGFGDFRI